MPAENTDHKPYKLATKLEGKKMGETRSESE
jgi:hypothetical protein